MQQVNHALIQNGVRGQLYAVCLYLHLICLLLSLYNLCMFVHCLSLIRVLAYRPSYSYTAIYCCQNLVNESYM